VRHNVAANTLHVLAMATTKPTTLTCFAARIRRMLSVVLFSLGALMLAPATASAKTLAERIAQLEPHLSVARPSGDGPFSVVLMLPGCGGRRPFLDTWSARIVSDGAAAVLIDSHAARGIGRLAALSTVCTGARMQGRERAGDLYAALAWTRQQPWVDQERIIAAGWSHGSWTIMDGLALRSGPEMRRATGITDLPDEPLAGLAATFLVYPYTSVGSLAGRRWRITPRSVAIACGRDFIVGDSRAVLQRQRNHGAPIEMHFFPHATHAFDEPEANDPRVRYDAQTTRQAETLLGDLIASVR
jgi:dienelactone hydrolase